MRFIPRTPVPCAYSACSNLVYPLPWKYHGQPRYCSRQCLANRLRTPVHFCPDCRVNPKPSPRSRRCDLCKKALLRRRQVKNLIQSFWNHTRVGDSWECWEWQGERRHSQRGQEYGAIRLCANKKRRWIGAHRLSYRINRGKIPDGLWVLHTCDNGLCVNPSHLYVGTHADNVRDMVERKRYHNPNTCSREFCGCRRRFSGAM